MPPPKLCLLLGIGSHAQPASPAPRALRPQVMSSLASVETPVPLSKRAVAGSFIFKLPTFVSASASPSRPYERPRVALFRRSAEVRSYPNKYAPISGSVDASDADPLATAWRELSEETGLTSDALRLLRVGKPYSFSDASVGREWLINPFAFALRHDGPGEAAIRLDWEHQDYIWLDPIDVAAADGKEASLDVVPRLLDSLRRVWFELDLGPDASQALDKGLYDLRRDQVSGARELAAKALDIFICVMTRLDTTISTECWWRNLRWAAWHLWKNGRETMGASILHVVLSCLTQIKARLPSTANLPVDFVDSAAAALTHVAKQRQDAGIKIQEAFTAFVRSVSSCTDHSAVPPHTKPLRILTLSSSSTVSSCLHHTLTHTNIPLHIHVLESRPLFEGASMAQTIASSARLSSSSSSVSVYTDASAGLAARNADLVLLGADLIDRDANVSNKMGSLPAVLAARHVAPAAAVVVAAEQDKILPFDPPTSVEDNGSAQVSSAWSQDVGSAADAANIHVSNVSFEWVPADLIDHYITEDGITISKDIANVARDAKLLADSFFASL